jgi:hypothetical protein
MARRGPKRRLDVESEYWRLVLAGPTGSEGCSSLRRASGFQLPQHLAHHEPHRNVTVLSRVNARPAVVADDHHVAVGDGRPSYARPRTTAVTVRPGPRGGTRRGDPSVATAEHGRLHNYSPHEERLGLRRPLQESTVSKKPHGLCIANKGIFPLISAHELSDLPYCASKLAEARWIALNSYVKLRIHPTLRPFSEITSTERVTTRENHFGFTRRARVMAVYVYRCPCCSEIEITFPIGTAPAAVLCPDCGAASVRAFSAPMLARTPAAMSTRLQRAERSAFEPEVVTSLPQRRTGSAAVAHPATSRLPRP